MKAQYSRFSCVVIGILLFFTSACTKENQADAENQTKTEVTFFCGTDKDNKERDVPTTLAKNSNKDQPIKVIYFDPNNKNFGDKWTPKARCQEISKRFQTIFDRDALKYITVDQAHWITNRKIYVICSVKKSDAKCEEEDLLFTLETKDDPNQVLRDFIAFRKEPITNKPITRGEKAKSFEEGKRDYYDLTTVLVKTDRQKAPSPRSAF